MTEWQTIDTAPIDRWVLAYSGGEYEVVRWEPDDGRWIDIYWETSVPTHWVSLPPPPKDWPTGNE